MPATTPIAAGVAVNEPREKKHGSRAFILPGKTDTIFLVIVLVLLSIGLIMMFSASYASAYYYKGNSAHYILRQLPFAILGVIGMLAVSKFDYHILHRFSWIGYGVSLILLIIVLKMPEISGVHRWIIIGPINFQPSEIAKFAVVLLYSDVISRTSEKKMRTFKLGLLRFLLFLLPIVVLMLREPHLSGTVLICALAAVLLFIGGTNIWYFVAGTLLVAAAVVFVILDPDILKIIAQYADTRIEVWLDPFSDAQVTGFQTVQSLYAIGSGGIMGVGIGNSRQKHLYLPEPYNDFIFAIVCEELGFVGATLILAIFALLVWRGMLIAKQSRDRFGALLSAGLTAQVGIQTFLNVAVVTNTIPNTGISLPFFSYGGTSLVMLLLEMGLVLSVARHTNSNPEKSEKE